MEFDEIEAIALEIVLMKAKVDEKFRGLVLEDPVSAAASIHLPLREPALSMLTEVPRSELGLMIRETFVPRQNADVFRTGTVEAMAEVLEEERRRIESIPITGNVAFDLDDRKMVIAGDLEILQEALEAYHAQIGGYPSTEEWYLRDVHPLAEFVDSRRINRLREHYRYRGYAPEVGDGYRLASVEDPEVDCPTRPESHRFGPEKHLEIISPERNPLSLALIDSPSMYTFRARHDDPEATVTWYWKRRKLGSSRGNHEMTSPVSIGLWGLFVIDDKGNSDYLNVFALWENSWTSPSST